MGRGLSHGEAETVAPPERVHAALLRVSSAAEETGLRSACVQSEATRAYSFAGPFPCNRLGVTVGLSPSDAARRNHVPRRRPATARLSAARARSGAGPERRARATPRGSRDSRPRRRKRLFRTTGRRRADAKDRGRRRSRRRRGRTETGPSPTSGQLRELISSEKTLTSRRDDGKALTVKPRLLHGGRSVESVGVCVSKPRAKGPESPCRRRRRRASDGRATSFGRRNNLGFTVRGIS